MYITSYGGTVSVFDLTKCPMVPFHAPIVVEYGLTGGITITPDQSPTSLFTFSISGMKATFDGSGSSSPAGDVVEYRWDFGDGTTATTTTPVTSHTYKKSGTHAVTLTVVNSEGTSTEVTFTGKTVSNNGSPRAQSMQTIILSPQAPASLTGKVRLDKKKREVILKMHWPLSADKNTMKYQIFAYGTCIADVPSNTNIVTLRLHPRHFPKRISKEYKRYLHNKYSLRSVNTEGVVSPAVKLDVK